MILEALDSQKHGPCAFISYGSHTHETFLPSSPDGVNIHPLGNIDNELDIGVVVVIGPAWDLGIDRQLRNSAAFCFSSLTSTY